MCMFSDCRLNTSTSSQVGRYVLYETLTFMTMKLEGGINLIRQRRRAVQSAFPRLALESHCRTGRSALSFSLSAVVQAQLGLPGFQNPRSSVTNAGRWRICKHLKTRVFLYVLRDRD
jgi:hypothetical protein